MIIDGPIDATTSVGYGWMVLTLGRWGRWKAEDTAPVSVSEETKNHQELVRIPEATGVQGGFKGTNLTQASHDDDDVYQ